MLGIQNRRVLAALLEVLKQFDMVRVPDIAQGRHFDHRAVAGEHIPRITCEEDVARVVEKAPIQIVEVMRHVFEEHDWGGMIRQHQITHDLFPVVFHFRDDLIRAGVVSPRGGFRQVVRVERFVKYGRVRPLGEGVHEGSGNIPGAAPEADAGNFIIHGIFDAKTQRIRKDRKVFLGTLFGFPAIRDITRYSN